MDVIDPCPLVRGKPCKKVDADAQAVPPGRASTSPRRPVLSAGAGAAWLRGQKERGQGQAGHGRSKWETKAPRETHPGDKARRNRNALLEEKPAAKGGTKKVQPRKGAGALGKVEAPKRGHRVATVPVANGAKTERRSRIEVAADIVEPPEVP